MHLDISIFIPKCFLPHPPTWLKSVLTITCVCTPRLRYLCEQQRAAELLMFAVWNIITLLSIFKTKYFTTMCRKHISPESGSLSPANGAFGCGGLARGVQAEGRPAPSALLLSCSHLCPRRFLPRSLVHSVSPVWRALVAPWPTASSFAITSVISLT